MIGPTSTIPEPVCNTLFAIEILIFLKDALQTRGVWTILTWLQSSVAPLLSATHRLELSYITYLYL